MGVTAVTLSVPQFTTDLRPAADAAASLRETRPAPAMALGPVPQTTPPVPTQAAVVSRLMLGTAVIEVGPPTALARTGTDTPERRLVPFGIFMLPQPKEEDTLPAPKADRAATPDRQDAPPKADAAPVAAEADRGPTTRPDAQHDDPGERQAPDLAARDDRFGDDGFANDGFANDEFANDGPRDARLRNGDTGD